MERKGLGLILTAKGYLISINILIFSLVFILIAHIIVSAITNKSMLSDSVLMLLISNITSLLGAIYGVNLYKYKDNTQT